ncbi:MAG: DUF2164 domain-containing protein [Stappiaceae bacterium]
MSEIKFSEEEKRLVREKLQAYFSTELDQELSRFDADFLFDFVCEELGPFFYNRGLLDAQAIMSSKMELVQEAVYELEKPIKGAR